MTDLSTKQEYKPVLVSRRSEITAWLLTICLILIVVFVDFSGLSRAGAYLLIAFLGISALVMSLGNWVDRQTRLTIEADGVRYFNGAREVFLPWEQISRVEILTSRFGDRIIVSSQQAAFRYQSAGQIEMSEKVTGKVGFAEGEQILETILQRSGLAGTDSRQTDKGYYYSRD